MQCDSTCFSLSWKNLVPLIGLTGPAKDLAMQCDITCLVSYSAGTCPPGEELSSKQASQCDSICKNVPGGSV